jgi:hypothetical protein
VADTDLYLFDVQQIIRMAIKNHQALSVNDFITLLIARLIRKCIEIHFIRSFAELYNLNI